MKRLLFRSLAIIVVALGASVGFATWHTSSATGSDNHEQDIEAIVHRGVTSCGVERWWVKTGIDTGAKSIDTKHVVSTTIFHLRSLPAPSYLPQRNRIKPTESTVFTVSGILLRYKQESDSDVHLVLSDTGGRTMIAEIPAPQCVGSASPFLPQITYTRRTFTSHYHPTTSWQRVNDNITVTGVGFFDFQHGQSGVAPNAIELHPVLAVKYSVP